MTSNDTYDLLTAWGVPKAYRCGESHPDVPWHLRAALRHVAGVANWYPEMDAALEAMVGHRDKKAVREWRDNGAWAEVARGTCDQCGRGDTCQSCREYCASVRAAFTALLKRSWR